MKIGIYTFELKDGRKDIGSSRIRGHWLAKYWPEAEIFKYGKQYDVVIFQKAYDLHYASEFKGLKILDLCVRDDSLIFSNRGWLYPSEIKIGDKLLTHNARFETVNEIFKRKKKTKSIKAVGLPKINITGNHPVFTTDIKYKCGVVNTNGFNFVPIDNLKKCVRHKGGNCLTSVAKRVNEIKSNLNENMGWFWGYYSAEGSRNINGISFAQHKDEREHKNKILSIIKKEFNKNGRYYLNDNCAKIDFNDRKLSNFIKDNIFSNDKKTVITDIFNADKNVKLNFLEGYIAGDGYCNDFGGICVSTISKKLAYSVWQLFRDCGIVANMNYHKRDGDKCCFVHKDGRVYEGKPQWRIQLNPKESLKFCRITNIENYKKCKIKYWAGLKSKNIETLKENNYYINPIREISDEEDKISDVYNFNVGDSHSYICDGVIVKNCDPDWLEWGARVREMISYCDAVTTSTEALAEYIRRITDKPVVHIADRMDLEYHKEHKTHNGSLEKVVWYGYHCNFQVLDEIVPILAKEKLKLIVIANKTFLPQHSFRKLVKIKNCPWKIDTVNRDIISADVVLNPQYKFNKWKYKSNNKTLTGWALGMPVARTYKELMSFQTSISRREEADKRLIEVKEKWDVKISVKEMQNLINKLKEKKNEDNTIGE